jgi:hypothetical protein
MVNGPSIVGAQWSKDMKTFFLKAILFRPKRVEGGRKVLDENNSPNYWSD